jgi:hypothetical protein
MGSANPGARRREPVVSAERDDLEDRMMHSAQPRISPGPWGVPRSSVDVWRLQGQGRTAYRIRSGPPSQKPRQPHGF